MRDVLEEARLFLNVPRPKPKKRVELPPAPTGSPESARRLFAGPNRLPARSPRAISVGEASRPSRLARCAFIRAASTAREPMAPPNLAGLDRRGHRSRRPITGAHRTWLDPPGPTRRRSTTAPGARPPPRQRRAVPPSGRSLTTSWRRAKESRPCCRSHARCPVPMVAALSANHLAALTRPEARPSLRRPRPRCRRPHGRRPLQARGSAATSNSAVSCRLGDFNEDLRRLGPGACWRLCAFNSCRRMSCASSARGTRTTMSVAACGSGRRERGIVHPANLSER